MMDRFVNLAIALLRKTNSFLLALYKKVSKKQIVGLILAVIGIYLIGTSLQAIFQVCGHCEKGPPLGWLGIVNPVLGLASLAEKDGAAFKFYVLWPLLGGIVLIIIGALLMILGKKGISSGKDQEKR